MITFLKILFSALLIWMCYVVITTSMESSLFKEWNFLGSIPWMRATLWDFYTNVLVIFIWICYKEKTIISKGIWLLLLITLGSIASCIYMLVQLFRLPPAEGLKELFGKKHG
ncbi:DUF1475 family protein [Chitinophaga sp.]|uniref:DUF1475 family protein n=1 Tax=Chitinophaga sp. TaxID=1869181 RepID=UPI0031D1E90F